MLEKMKEMIADQLSVDEDKITTLSPTLKRIWMQIP